MNHAMHMHPCWGATTGPEVHRQSMQNWQPESQSDGLDGPRGGSIADETLSPDMAAPQGPGGERRRGDGKRRQRGRHRAATRMDRIDDPFGPMFGPGGPSRGQRRGRGRRNRGDVRASVLLLLDERPRHGYEILMELADRSDGNWRPSPGSIYPVLKSLTEEGLVHPEQEEGRRVFHLTDEGREMVGRRRESWGEPWLTESPVDPPALTDLRKEAKQLAGAVWQVVQAEDDQHLRQTTTALAKARKSIYLMLAEEEPETLAEEEPETLAQDEPDADAIPATSDSD